VVELRGAKSLQGKALKFPNDLILWEVDFSYDGDVFHSQHQLARDWRSGDLPLRITLPVDHGKLAVRAIDVHGRSGLYTLPK
jgi:hypothetical protein